jgi:hypothetical protein
MEVGPKAERFGSRLTKLCRLSLDLAKIANASRHPIGAINACLNIRRTAIDDTEVMQRDAHLFPEVGRELMMPDKDRSDPCVYTFADMSLSLCIVFRMLYLAHYRHVFSRPVRACLCLVHTAFI